MMQLVLVMILIVEDGNYFHGLFTKYTIENEARALIVKNNGISMGNSTKSRAFGRSLMLLLRIFSIYFLEIFLTVCKHSKFLTKKNQAIIGGLREALVGKNE